MAAADYRLLTEATGQRIAAALEALSGTGAAAAAARTNLDVYSKGETDTAIAQSTAKNALTLTRTENPYVDSTSFGRLFAYKYGSMYLAAINLSITTPSDQSVSETEIGRISNWAPLSSILTLIPPQNGTNKTMLLRISNGGVIYIAGTQGLAQTFYRGEVIAL